MSNKGNQNTDKKGHLYPDMETSEKATFYQSHNQINKRLNKSKKGDKIFSKEEKRKNEMKKKERKYYEEL